MGLNGCLTVGKNIYVPTYVALMAYIVAWNTVGWSPRLKLCPLFKPNLYASAAPVLLLVLDMSMYQTRPPQCSFQVWTHSVIHTCQGTWPWVACGMPWYHLVNSCLWNGFMLHVLRFSSMTENCGFRFPLLAAHSSVDLCLGLCLKHHMKRSEAWRDLHCSCWSHPYCPYDNWRG